MVDVEESRGNIMKVIVPANEPKIQGGLCASFGRAPYFIVLDTESEDVKVIENPGASSSGGAGIKAAQVVADEKVEVLLVPRIGKNAWDVLDAAHVKIYKSVSEDILTNIRSLKDHTLDVLTDIHPGFHGHGDKE